MDAVKATLVGASVAAFGIVSAFVGGLINQRMTRNAQHEQWFMDQRKEEWRELLTALAEALRSLLRLRIAAGLDSDDERAIVAVQSNTFRVIRDRIFIAADVERLNIENRWSKACMDHHKSLDPVELGKQYDILRREIVNIATDATNHRRWLGRSSK
jgi:hypothetical protein